MSLLDSFTSFFSSDIPTDASVSEPSTPLYNSGMMLSTHYSLGNLIATNQKLSQPNMPNADQLDNLHYTADMLEQLNSKIGAFTIISGFRTKELQSALSAAGEPTATGTSFHELGRAVDIAPVHMTLAEYFGKILADQDLADQFAEIAIKPAQGSLHLAVNVPGDMRTPKVMGLNTEGIYAKLGLEDIANYIQPFMASAEAATDYAAAKLVSFNKTPLMITAGVAVIGLAYLFMAKKKNV